MTNFNVLILFINKAIANYRLSLPLYLKKSSNSIRLYSSNNKPLYLLKRNSIKKL